MDIENNVTLNPESVFGDFEKASTNAIKYHFPNVEIKGCWFHHRQVIMKAALGLYSFYHLPECSNFMLVVQALTASLKKD